MQSKNFRTRTEFIDRDNGRVKNVWEIAMDIGYSSVKLFSPNSVAAFPSYAKRMDDNFSFMFEAPKEAILYKDNETGHLWMVGKIAEDSTDDGDTSYSENFLYGRDRYFSDMFKVIALTGLGIASRDNRFGGPGASRIVVQTGLPERYMNDAALLKNVIAGEHDFSLKIGNSKWRTFRLHIEPNDIHVMPQPKGTLYSICTARDGHFTPDAKKILTGNTAVFDAGFGTLDLFSFGNGIMKDEETYSDLGMKRVLKEACKMLRAQHNIVLDVPHMQSHLEDGFIRNFDRIKEVEEEYPLDGILEIATSAVCNEAINRIKDIIYNSKCENLVVTGGTGEAWFGQLKDKLKVYPRLNVIEGNKNDDLPFIYANVRGYYFSLYRKL